MFYKKLHIEFLNYLLNENGLYEDVESKDFLIKKFPEENDFNDRKKMKQFLNRLNEVKLINLISHHGLFITTVVGKKITRDEISAKVYLTVDGYELLNKHRINRINKVSMIFNFIFGILTIFLTLKNNSLKDNQMNFEKLESKIKVLNSKIDSLSNIDIETYELKTDTLNINPNKDL
jgi:ribosome-binding factor A